MNKTNLLLGAVGVVALVVAILALSKPAQVIVERGIGAVTSSENLTSPMCVDGICRYQTKIVMTSPSQTPCAIKSPNATTTLERHTINITVGSSTAATLSLATSTTATATTTNLATYTLTANTQNTYSFAGTSGAGIVPPNTWIVLGAAGGPANGHQLTGTCSADLRQVN